MDCGDCADCDCDCSPFLVFLPWLFVTKVLPGALRPVTRLSDPPPGLAARGVARLIRSYQVNVSAHRTRPICRMQPHCSAYGMQALTRHGLLRGLRLTGARVRRCGKPAGYDPVP